MPQAGFDASYGTNPAENYERFFVPVIGEPLARHLVGRMGIEATDRVLDVACGTGIVARVVARATGKPGNVAGLDPNPAMLAVARTVAPELAEWHEAPAERMPVPDTSSDVVACQMGLQFMADHPAAMAEMCRVLNDGGRFWLSLPGPTTGIFAALASALERHIGPQAGAFVTKVFSLHDVNDIEAILHGAGLREIAVEATVQELELPPARDFLWQYIHSTPLAGVASQATAEARAALEREVLAAWQDFEADGVLKHELRVVIATGVRLHRPAA